MTRKLVTIRQVSQIDPIPDADLIEVLTIEGWKVVSQKGNFKVGDPCVYFEIDSFLPDGNPLWQDLVDKSNRIYEGKKGHVLRTMKLRGQVSQGFCIPVHQFPNILAEFGLNFEENVHYTEGGEKTEIDALVKKSINEIVLMSADRDRDWAELLGVVKYELPIPAEIAGEVVGPFPSFIRKTDQERCQNLEAEIFADLDAKYEVTIKLDGTSMTAFHDPNGVGGVCMRNYELKTTDGHNESNTLVRVAKGSDLLNELEKNPNYAVQGELMGPGIQGNREQLKVATFFMFDVFDMAKGEYLPPDERREYYNQLIAMIHQSIGPLNVVQHVPVLHQSISLRELGITNMTELLAFAEGKSLKHDVREGVVFKRVDGKFSFKAISNKFLLKQKE